jgi:uncharacterized protein (DUF2345 family)
VLINGLNAATQGSTGGHGNVVMGGSGTVIIGDTFIPAPFSGLLPMPMHFSDKFRLVDQDSGEPLPNLDYAIQRADGSMEHGVSDSMGYTHLVSSHLPETIKLFLED